MKKRRPYGMYVTGQRPASAHLYFEVFRIASDAFFGRCANRWDFNWSKEIELNAAGAVGGNWQIALHSIKKRVSYKRKRSLATFRPARHGRAACAVH